MSTLKNRTYDKINEKLFAFKKIEQRIYENCIFENMSFDMTNFNYVSFINCSFKFCIFNRQSFNTVKIKECFFESAHFLNSTLESVTVSNSEFKEGCFSNSYFKNSTIDSNIFNNTEIAENYFLFCDFKANSMEDITVSENSFFKVFVRKNKLKKIFINKNFFDANSNIERENFCDDALDKCFFKNMPSNVYLGKCHHVYGIENLASIRPFPEEGSFIGYKKCWYEDNEKIKYCIVKLLILEDAERLGHLSNGKCRCDKAKVIGIEDMHDKSIKIKTAYSIWDNNFIYRVGEIIIPDSFNNNKEVECSHGIHFFIDKRQAMDYLD